jgi:site-specific DNA-methyltransferase (adenine-specific)/modification methylase
MRVEQIGRATLYNADCREVLPALDKVDAVVTDPPYGIYAVGGKWGKKADLHWDKETPANIADVVNAGSRAIIWGGNYFALPPSRGWLVWRKPDRVPSAADVELAWTSMDMNARLIDHSIAATNEERVGHPTQKPLRVMRWTLSFVQDAKTILDPFMGSGTTGVAAVLAGMDFVGIERELRYFDLACRRIEQAQRQGDFFVEAAA